MKAREFRIIVNWPDVDTGRVVYTSAWVRLLFEGTPAPRRIHASTENHAGYITMYFVEYRSTSLLLVVSEITLHTQYLIVHNAPESADARREVAAFLEQNLGK